MHNWLKKLEPMVMPIPIFVEVMKRDIIDEKNCGSELPAANKVLFAVSSEILSLSHRTFNVGINSSSQMMFKSTKQTGMTKINIIEIAIEFPTFSKAKSEVFVMAGPNLCSISSHDIFMHTVIYFVGGTRNNGCSICV